MTVGSESQAPTTVIRPNRGLADLGLDEVWAYRELLYFLAWRDVKVRYKQTLLGVLWVVLQPLVSTDWTGTGFVVNSYQILPSGTRAGVRR